MANKKVSELTAITNIQDGDLVEITKYMGAGLGDGGGDYKSYKMTWSALKTFFKYDEIVKIDFAAAGSQLYQVSRYERVESYVHIAGSLPTETLKIANNHYGYIYLDETDADCGDINYFTQVSNATQRVLKLTLSDPGTVYLFVTKNLIP